MNIRKALVIAACCFIIVAGVNYLLSQFPATPTANASAGGAAQYEGKHDIKDSPYFAHPDIYNLQSNGQLTILSHYKTRQQTTYYNCGPTAANTVVVHFFGKPLHSEAEICKMMSTSTTNGTTAKGMAAYFKKIGWQVRSSASEDSPASYRAFLDFVSASLRENTPIMVENVDWGGHWRVIIGYDTMGTEHLGDDVLLMADPFDTSDHLQDGYNIAPAERFYYMWFDSQLFSRSEQRKQWVAAKPPAAEQKNITASN